MAAVFDVTRYQDPLVIQQVLLTAKTIAIVGLSSNTLRASHFVGFYLRRHGYRVIPVNPREKTIFGERSYATLREVTEPIDIVNVFRAPDALPGIATDAVAKAEKLDVPVSYSMMEGYINAKVIVEAVRRQGARPTREGMAAALDGMGNYNLGGYVVAFKPGMRTGSKFVELSIISGSGKIRQ